MKKYKGFLLLESLMALSLLVSCLVLLFQAMVSLYSTYEEVKQNEMTLISEWLS